MIIADSSGLMSLINPSDQNYSKAQRVLKKTASLNASIVIPTDVFSETLNITGKKFGHIHAIEITKLVAEISAFFIVAPEPSTRDRALAMFKSQPESVSFTDCMVMATAELFTTKQIFGFDEIFKKNGFVRVGIDE